MRPYNFPYIQKHSRNSQTTFDFDAVNYCAIQQKQKIYMHFEKFSVFSRMRFLRSPNLNEITR